MKAGRLLVKINRICAWMLLIFMIVFLISGYAWWNRSLSSLITLQQARYMHTELDLFLVFFFLVHVLISIKFALARWRMGHGRIVNLLLVMTGILSLWFILSIR